VPGRLTRTVGLNVQPALRTTGPWQSGARIGEYRRMPPSPDATVARLMLVARRRDTVAVRDPDGPRVRRYRLARVQLNPPRTAARPRLEYLKQQYD
jgi:hypothetical protein